MVQPANFGFNHETAANNSFQTENKDIAPKEIQKLALKEFNNMVDLLKANDIEIIVIKDTIDPIKPDAIFPNNWFSTHATGSLITYPMFAKNRRLEKRQDIIDTLNEKYQYKKRYTFDYHEDSDQFLEGTGSMILDRSNKVVYACLSLRTEIRILEKFCVLLGYNKIVFDALDRKGDPIYHTNVMMALGEELAIVCLTSIQESIDREKVRNSLVDAGKTIIDISMDQMEQFAGNMLEVLSKNGSRYLIMSKTAYDSLKKKQIEQIEKKSKILTVPIPTIELYGGGSVRCMMAEIYEPI